MLIEWTNWVRSLHTDEIIAALGILLLIDAPRYAFSALIMAVWDLLRNGWKSCLPGPHAAAYDYFPSVSVIIAGHNEARTIAATMQSVWERYPHLQLVVVDDGSTDGMADVAETWADGRDGITIVRREQRGGKSSALNHGLRLATGEIVVTVDADSRLSDSSLYELIQPMKDPGIAAVAGTVMAWNPFVNLATWLQAYEYRQTIFVSRMLRGRLGMLGIVSGAFGAYRATALRQLGGWDVGPGEDGDLALRLRKAGLKIAVAAYANCYTNVPTCWIRLFRQRCRWDRTVITFECRKHNDLGCPWKENFRWSDFFLMVERWFFNVVAVYTFWLYGIWIVMLYPGGPLNLLLLLYCCGMCVELLQALILLYYSDRPKHDLALALALPFYPLFQVYLKAVGVYALTREIFLRDSGDDNFVPAHVRKATWRW